MVTEFIEDIIDAAHDAFEARDDIGAIKAEVWFVSRSWSGRRIGDGTATETRVQMLPTPNIVDLSHNARVVEGGIIKQGDIIIKSVSKKAYPNESDVNCLTTTRTSEKFIEIGGYLYQVIHVKSQYHCWDIHVRRLSNQTRY